MRLPNLKTNLKKWAGIGVRLFVLGMLVVHFTLTILYAGPLNPLKLQLMPLLQATIGSFFPQNWSLFAPNPIAADFNLLVRCVKKDGTRSEVWYDITAPMWKRYQENRFSAYDRLSRTQGNTVRRFMSGGPQLNQWRDACEHGSAEACKMIDDQLKIEREAAGKMLARLGSAFCKDVSGGDCVAMDMRMRERLSRPWSKRHEKTRASQDFDLGTFPYDPKVASTGLYRIGGRS